MGKRTKKAPKQGSRFIFNDYDHAYRMEEHQAAPHRATPGWHSGSPVMNRIRWIMLAGSSASNNILKTVMA